MRKIINFLVRFRNLILYGFLMMAAVALTIQSHEYHMGMLVNSTGDMARQTLAARSDVTRYFNLTDQNRKLQQENAYLRMRLLRQGDTLLGAERKTIFTDSVPYVVMPARVIKNDYHRSNNYLLIDVGRGQGIRPDMGVISPTGIVGIVDKTTNDYSRVISVLNTSMQLAAQIKGTNTLGTLTWDGGDPYILNLIDVPRLARVAKGDTIVTGQQSTAFPPDIVIGTIKNIELIESGTRYEIDVQLANDMTDIGYVNVIKKRDAAILRRLDTIVDNGQ